MKTLKAFGIATLIAASATTAFAESDDAAKQTPFVYGAAANAGNFEVRVNRGTEDAAKQTPFVYEEAADAVTRANTSVLSNRFLRSDDDAAKQTPFIYAN